eukprot:gene13361-4214_t
MVTVFLVGNILLFKNWGHPNTNGIQPVKFSSRTYAFRDSNTDEGSQGRWILKDNHDVHNNPKNYEIEGKQAKIKVYTKAVDEVVKSNKDGTDKLLNGNKNVQLQQKEFKYRTAILVIACNRPSVRQCLDQIFRHKPKHVDMPVIVSQDCGDVQTENVIKSYGQKLKLVKQPDFSDVVGVPGHMRHFMGYYKISRHYKFALKQAFKEPSIDSVIIIEDDLDIAPDFFEYFMATRPLLDMDKSLFCVSAWNDNGKEGFVKDHELLYRSDFFPGLGWLLTRKFWEELEPKWPLGFWDDWIRDPHQRKNRACIRPEISRSKTFGRVGVSQGQFYDQYLKYIQLNDEFFAFRKADLSYLLKFNYDKDFVSRVYKKRPVSADDVLNDSIVENAVRIQYSSNTEVESLARKFGLMTDLKAGVPRTAYKGIVSFVHNGKRVYLTPPSDWTGYSES